MGKLNLFDFNNVSKVKWFAALLITITAYFSLGAHHPDEYFQILEFANYKLGGTKLSDLPWEYSAKIRPGLQPLLTYLIIKALYVIGLVNPFYITFFLRLTSGIISLFLIFKLADWLKSKVNFSESKIIGLLLLLWFVPYMMVRFSSENWSGFTFMFGLLILLKNLESKKTLAFILSGFLLALSFYFRFQMGAAILGLGLWILFYKKYSLNLILSLSLGLVIGFFVGALADFWLYDEFVFTPLNYFSTNILEGKAAEFGVFPWWYYFYLFIIQVAPPISILIFVCFVFGVVKNKSSVFLWTLIPFLLLHFAVGHKEMRFLLPVLSQFLILAIFGFNSIKSKLLGNKLLKIAVIISLVINFGFLTFRSIAPSQEQFSYYKFLYTQSVNETITVVTIDNPLFEYVHVPVNFVKSKNVVNINFSTFEEASDSISKSNYDNLYLYHKGLKLDKDIDGFDAVQEYSLLPKWIKHLNFNDWQSRARIYSIYRLNKK